jgi:membrane protein
MSPWQVIKNTFNSFLEDEAMRQAAAVAYYAALALAPLLIMVVLILGWFYSDAAAQGRLVDQFQGYVGEAGAEIARQVATNAAQATGGGWAAVISIGILVFAATSLFAQLQIALNRIWNVKAAPGNTLMTFLRKRLLSLGMILCVGFLLLVSMIASTAIKSIVGGGESLTGWSLGWLWQTLTILVQAVVFFGLFAAMFRYLPDVIIRWNETLIGAAVTAGLFIAGQQLLSLYLSTASVGSAYGAAGSLVAVLVWVYYTVIIVLLGAEFTQVLARRAGHRIEPAPHAVADA